MQILVPIRDPYSPQSRTTVEHASGLARSTDAHLIILHINLRHHSKRFSPTDISWSLVDLVGDVDVSYVTREGFFVEELILEELDASQADLLVIGQDYRPSWRQALSRLFGRGQDIAQFLQTQSQVTVDVV